MAKYQAKKIKGAKPGKKVVNVKAVFARNMAIGLTGVACAVLFSGLNSFGGLVPIGGILLAVYGLSRAFNVLHDVIDVYFPIIKIVREDVTHRMARYLGWAVLIVSVIFLIAEIHELRFTIGGLQLVILGTATGLLFAIAVLCMLKFTVGGVFAESTRRYSIIKNFVLGGLFLGPAIAGYVNTSFTNRTAMCNSYTISNRYETYHKGTTYHIDVRIGDIIKGFIIDEALYDRVYRGGTVKLCIKKGGLGYDFVTDIKK